MRALVTGSSGFVGRVLVEHLAARGWDVFGCDSAQGGGDMNFRRCDLSNEDQVDALMEWSGAVTHVFHLAGITFVPQANDDPSLAMRVNLIGTINLARALKQWNRAARLIFVGTADIYGTPRYLPIDEAHPVHPLNPYSISKAAADAYCEFLGSRGELDIVRARPFNHTGAGQGDRFVLSSFARQIAAIEAGKAEPVLNVGNLESARDFSHVGDVVRAYEALALQGQSGGAYNICSGRSWKIRDAMERLIAMTGTEIRVEVDPGRYRPEATPEVRGSHEKLTNDTGWQPEIGFETLLSELLNSWRAKLV